MAAVSVDGHTYRMSVLGDVLFGCRPELGAYLHRAPRLDEEGDRTLPLSMLVNCWNVKYFLHTAKLYLVHAELHPISRPWQKLQLSVSHVNRLSEVLSDNELATEVRRGRGSSSASRQEIEELGAR